MKQKERIKCVPFVLLRSDLGSERADRFYELFA